MVLCMMSCIAKSHDNTKDGLQEGATLNMVNAGKRLLYIQRLL